VDARDERELARRARRGDAEAFADLAMRHADACWRAAYVITLSMSAAEDAVQEAFARALLSISQFDSDRPFGPWIKRIATNCALDELRARRRADVLDDALAGEIPAPGTESQLGPVWAAVAALPNDRRVPITMHYVLGFTYAEIAATLDCPIGTVASRVTRGLEMLRRTMEVSSAARD
jgi:RNA polymerase sigma factor (sigma-70 family)